MNTQAPSPTATSELKREEATLVDIQFRSESGLWGIGLFKRPDGSTFTATGEFGHAVLFEDFILHGARKPDLDGADFDVAHFTSMPPKSTAQLSGYLSALTGVPRASTVKVVEMFGDDTIDILERSAEKLVDAGIPERDVDRLRKGWEELRSNQIALAKVDIEGIPPHKLSKLQRNLGYTIDLNAAIKEDPYLLYINFDDMLFTSAQSLARRLGVSNDTTSAVKGAVIATLRKEAWLGHSYVEGKPLIESCMGLLKIDREKIRPLIGEAVTSLAKSGLIHVAESRAQLMSLHQAERTLIKLAVEWAHYDANDLDDLVPSEEMGLKLLKPLKLKANDARPLNAGLSALLGDRFGLVQCETLEDQFTIAYGLSLILTGFGTDTVFATYTCEMASELRKRLGEDASVVTYSTLVGLDPDTGIPMQRETSPISAEVVVLVAADALGVEEMTHILEAMPKTGRLFMLGCPKDLPSLTVGKPFVEMVQVKDIRSYLASFWLPARTEGRITNSRIWAGTLTPKLDTFDPSDAISWLPIPRDMIPMVLPELIKGLAGAKGVSPMHDVRLVSPAQRANDPIGDVHQWLAPALAKAILGSDEPVQFQGKPFIQGLPVVIRQPIGDDNYPAFSIFTPEQVSRSQMQVRATDQAVIEIQQHTRIDVFPAAVMTPKFIRGRIYECVVLLVLKEHHHLINRELISTLLNSTRTTLLLAGEIEGLGDGFADRAGSQIRSKLPNWIMLNVD